MKTIFIYFLFSLHFVLCDVGFSQKKNNFVFEFGTPISYPKIKTTVLKGNPSGSHVINYDLSTTFLTGVGFRVAVGYDFNLVSLPKSKIRLPILFSYKRLVERMRQYGTYDGGFHFSSFKGNRKLTMAASVLCISTGISYIIPNNKNQQLGFECFFAENLNFFTNINRKEVLDANCQYCSVLSSEKYTDRQFFHSVDLRIFKLFKIKKYSLGPFFSYTFNYYYDPFKNQLPYHFVDKFDNPVINLQFYQFFETGLKIKL